MGSAAGEKSGNLRIVANNDSNALMILTNPAEFSVIEAALQRLDAPGRQVLIEASLADPMVMYRIVLTDEYLEEAQRLSLAQHTTLRLMCQTAGVWWLPTVIFAAALVFLLLEKLTLAAVVMGAFLV